MYSRVITNLNINYQLYADDIQVYISLHHLSVSTVKAMPIALGNIRFDCSN